MIDVFLIHGIGKSLPPRYYDHFVSGIRENLPVDADVVFHPIDYSKLLDKKEATILSWMSGMSWSGIRGFICNYVCDALSYAYPARPTQEGDFIYDLTTLLSGKMDKTREGSKVVVTGHSLGSIVGYGITWGIHTDCLITMGSPFLYFSIRYKDFGDMNPNLRQFHNFWRSRDPVSTIISRSPKFKCVHDYEVKSFNPRYWFMFQSHSIYWKSKFVHKKIASILRNL